MQGCTISQTVKDLRDPDLKNGCKMVEAKAGIGLGGNKGEAAVCKLKCGKIPKGYKFNYNNPYTGCSGKVGYDGTEPEEAVLIREGQPPQTVIWKDEPTDTRFKPNE